METPTARGEFQSEGVTEEEASSIGGIDLYHKLRPWNHGKHLDPFRGVTAIEQTAPLLHQAVIVRIYQGQRN